MIKLQNKNYNIKKKIIFMENTIIVNSVQGVVGKYTPGNECG